MWGEGDEMQDLNISVTVRFCQEDVDWLDGQVEKVGVNKTDRSEQIRLCVLQRRISLLSYEDRRKLARKFGVKLGGDRGLALDGGEAAGQQDGGR